jgi:predicted GTPase
MDATEVFQARAYISKYKPPPINGISFPHVNVFIFGGMGVGKSSFINTLFSAVGYKIMNPAKTRSSTDKSITLDFFVRDLTDKIYIYDAWGWSKTNYQNREFQRIHTSPLPSPSPLCPPSFPMHLFLSLFPFTLF